MLTAVRIVIAGKAQQGVAAIVSTPGEKKEYVEADMTLTVTRMAWGAFVCAMALGCASSGGAGGSGGGAGAGGSGAGGSGGTGMQPAVCPGNVVASEQNDYSFTSAITLTPVSVASMANLAFDWSGLTRDFQGHELSPTEDLGLAIVMFWDLPLAAGATSAHLYDFTINTTPVTPDMINPYFDAAAYPPTSASFIVGVETGTVLGRNLRMMQAFNLDASTSATSVPITNDSMKLSYTANLHDLTSTLVPAGTPALSLDWSQMITNGLGREFILGNVTDAIVGHYSETPAELEGKFLDLDRIALTTYRASIPSGFVLDFKTLKDKDGASFPGVDDNGTWLVGLLCGNCRNPAPWYMTILKPCSK